MRFVALDLSLTSTGVADDTGVRTIKVPLPANATEKQRVVRLHKLSCEVDRATRGADLVLIEGHSFHSKNSHSHSLGELHGVVKVVLFQRRIDFVYIAPSTLKQYATGKGNANKDQVLAAAVRHVHNHEIPFDIQSNDEADAFWLRDMAKAHYEQRDVVAPDYRNKALRAVKWPRHEEREGAA